MELLCVLQPLHAFHVGVDDIDAQDFARGIVGNHEKALAVPAVAFGSSLQAFLVGEDDFELPPVGCGSGLSRQGSCRLSGRPGRLFQEKDRLQLAEFDFLSFFRLCRCLSLLRLFLPRISGRQAFLREC